MKDLLRMMPVVMAVFEGDERALEALVIGAWRRVSEGAWAEHVVPFEFSNGVIRAAVENETWRRNIADLGPQLAGRINAVFGQAVVKFIEFRVEPTIVSRHRSDNSGKDAARKRFEEALDHVEIGSIADAALAIEDEEMRTRFLAAARADIARSKIGRGR